MLDKGKAMREMNAIHSTSTNYASGTSAQPKRSRAALWVTLAALVIIIPLVLVSLTVILFQVYQWNLPGVAVFNQDVGLMTYDDTVEWVDAYWNESRLITLSHPDQPNFSFILSPRDLGYWVDPVATANAAYNIGRDSTPWAEIRTALAGKPQLVSPVMYFDDQAARETLTALAEELNVSPKEAQILYQDGAWSVISGTEGQSLNIEATIDLLFADAYSIYLTQSATLQMNGVSPVVSDLSPLLDEIETAVAQDLPVTAYDPITDEFFNWSVPQEVKREWVEIDSDANTVTLTYVPNHVAALLAAWETELGNGRTFEADPGVEDIIAGWQSGETRTLIINHAPTTYQVGTGESLWGISLKLGMPMWRIMDANEGLTTTNLETGMVLTIPSKNDLLPLPVVPSKRIVIDISDQRMTVYEDGQLIHTYVVSTGISNSPTMAGIFQIQTHEINAYASNWDLYMPHFMGIYEAWPGFMNGIHGLPLLSSGVRLWASTLGSPASYGCIILDLAAAEDLYFWADAGVVVEINQ
jgi:LysM repeat protein